MRVNAFLWDRCGANGVLAQFWRNRLLLCAGHGFFGTVRDRLLLVSVCLEFAGRVSDSLGLFGTVWDCLGLLGIVWDCLGLSGIVWNW